jgi:signal transduction histidine kinase
VEYSPVQWNRGVVLQPGQTKIEFHYTGINFLAPARIRFRYRLEGFDDDWRDAGYGRFAQYTNLDPGNYRFRVIAVNNAGVWNHDGAFVDVTVLPPFWATWWFRGMVIVFFLTVGPVIYWYRVRQLKREKEEQREFSRRLLSSQEEERQRIANELHDSLGQNLLVLKNKILVAQEQNGARGDLEDMSGLVSQTIEEVRNISHNLRPHQLDQLGVSKTIRAMIRKLAASSTIEFTADVDDVDDLLEGDEDIGLFRIIQESVNNIVKHSGSTKAAIELKRTEDGIFLTIRDNGTGIAGGEEGFGLSGMRERVRILGGVLEIRQAEGGGTIIEMKTAKQWKTDDVPKGPLLC